MSIYQVMSVQERDQPCSKCNQALLLPYDATRPGGAYIQYNQCLLCKSKLCTTCSQSIMTQAKLTHNLHIIPPEQLQTNNPDKQPYKPPQQQPTNKQTTQDNTQQQPTAMEEDHHHNNTATTADTTQDHLPTMHTYLEQPVCIGCYKQRLPNSNPQPLGQQ